MLNPGTIALCNAGFGDTVIQSWTAKTLKKGVTKKIDLKCGDKASGYVHIRAGKQASWQGVINWAGGGGNWDDLMAFATGGALKEPTPGFPVDAGSNKWCYTSPMIVTNNKGATKTWNPTILVSSNNSKVITSYPTSIDNC